jgi:D-aminopeptidase
MNREKMRKFPPGKKNAITDLEGIKVGHLTVNKDIYTPRGDEANIRTGLTAILPYPMEKEMRLFMGTFNLRGKNEMTGYEVAGDFRYLNSPVVMTNPCNVGRAYNAVLSYGFSLNRVEIWPPLIVGIDDSYLNDITESVLEEKDILDTFHKASQGPVERGSAGIGFGLRAYGYKGGTGTASRMIELAGRNFTCGVLAASNHGNPRQSVSTEQTDSSGQKEENGGSFTLVVGVDIPLIPYQIDSIVESLIFELTPLLDFKGRSDDITCIFFTTANPMAMEEGGPMIREFRAIRDEDRGEIVMAAKEAALEALVNSLLEASPVQGREGRKCETIPEAEIETLIKTVV